ncbi:unnamed protein product [Spodoptera littoralis]|uniref:PH domain-containing protein n=1 Tax=Spodoptera littoralis TaxID=7109 RepID=A0A9P0MWL2_SPOLI|nr:unnamed protein product [Spodoptera littoralis]CAH1636063.1 unnamed protein product [Spodoptera littoralis]
MATATQPSCMSTEHGCVMFDCLVHLWEWRHFRGSQLRQGMGSSGIFPALLPCPAPRACRKGARGSKDDDVRAGCSPRGSRQECAGTAREQIACGAGPARPIHSLSIPLRLDPPAAQSQYQMENKKIPPATQQPLTQQHLLAHHVHPEQIYSQHHPQLSHLSSSQTGQIQPNGVMHQLLQSQYHSNMNARSPLLENRHDLYSTGHNHDYARHYGANDNYNYPQSPPRHERTEVHTDQNVNHELLHNIPKGYNAEVYQDYLKRNPPKDTNQIYQNHQPMYRPNVNPNQYGSKPYLPYSNRIGPQSNTELLRRQYSEIQQMKLQQQLHYQNQAQMHQQQKFAERQLLLQQIHGVQPPPNLQNSIYSDGSYRDLDRYSSKNDFKEYSSPDIQKDIDSYAKNNEYKEYEKQNRQYEAQWNQNQQAEYREQEQQYRRQLEMEKGKSQSPPSDYKSQSQKNNMSVASPMKSSESSTPSVKSPSSDSRRSSGGNQALRSPIAHRVPSAPVTMSGILYKQGSDGLKVWRKRWFVLSEYCLFYYKSQDEEKLLGSVLLPSYKVSGCTAEDKVLRKFAFKLEHANMRTYVLAAPDQEAMMKWVKALTMAALMQSPNEQPQKQSDRTAAKTEDVDEIPTYANAPPKPRRSNEGYNSPSPDMYDPNYDLLKKPASHYSQGTSHARYQDHANYPASPNQEPTYTRSPQSPPPVQQQPQYQTKRPPYDTQHLSLPLTNTVTDKLENNQPSTSSMYKSNPQSPYFDRNRSQQQMVQENREQNIYERQSQRNPFLQDTTPQTETSTKDERNEQQNNSRSNMKEERSESVHKESLHNDSRNSAKSNLDLNAYNRDVYGELTSRQVRAGSALNERLMAERRTPDAYGRSTTMSAYNKGKMGDYEDVYSQYVTENDYGKTYAKSPNPSQGDAVSTSSNQQQQKLPGNYPQEKTFSGPSVLRRKKMQSSGIQPPMPRPHSADFLEYESKAEMLNRTAPSRSAYDSYKEPQRPKSSLDINSYYDPSSDRYYSEESYAEKMRQSAQYLQQGLVPSVVPRNMEIPLANYASGLAKKQLSTAYTQMTNNNYEAEFSSNRDNVSFNSKYGDLEALNSNWTLKEKEIQKEYLNRSGSVMSDGSNVSGYVKEAAKYDTNADGFMRSASARLPSTSTEKEGEKKVQQREESMKRLLEWKQRMLQSPLTRKSTPATISLARSLNHSRQSLRSDQYKSKTYTNASYNSYSSDDEEGTSGTDLQKPRDMQAGRSHKVNLTSPIIMRPITPHAPSITQTDPIENTPNEKMKITKDTENTYQNVLCTISVPKVNLEDDLEKSTLELEQEKIEEHMPPTMSEDGYETEDSEAESETQMEYTDNDLDEVLLDSDEENQNNVQICDDKEIDTKEENNDMVQDLVESKPETPPVAVPGENHYLPMSPRKVSVSEPPHKAIIESLSVFDQSMPQTYEDNPYVEMNLGNEDDDAQTYEVVCVNNGKIEPVYMELSNVSSSEPKSQDGSTSSKLLDTASNFAESNNHTLKRANKTDKNSKEKSETSDVDDETSKDVSLHSPFSRFSISDTFRPASYYLNSSKSTLDVHDSSDSEISLPPPVPTSSPPCDDLSDEALSKYILEKLDKSDMSYDNSILKMLTSENQKMNTVKRKTTSLMIYGSRTSIHDTLSRGEKIRNSRASLTNERNKMSESACNLLSSTLLDHYNQSSSIETDSLRSYSAERGSSRLSLESDVSSKFELVPSNLSSEVTSLNGSELAIDYRHPIGYRDLEMMIKRRPLSDESLLELVKAEIPLNSDNPTFVDLDRYLDNLQAGTSEGQNMSIQGQLNSSAPETSNYKDNVIQAALQTATHSRSSSTPLNHNSRLNSFGSRNSIGQQFRHLSEQTSSYTGSQSSCSSSEPSFELATTARSVSVEFLSAADKDPEIDMKNIYESTGGRNSKIPESMNLSGLGCKRNSSSYSFHESSSPESNAVNASSLIKLSSTSMSSHCSGNSSNTVYYDAEADASAYENVVCQGDRHWDEDSLWRDNLRRVSHRHARSMDDLDSMPAGTSLSTKISEASGMSSIKRVKKDTINKISRNVTYVNCDIQGRVLRNKSGFLDHFLEEEQKLDENDVYVSLAESIELSSKQSDEGVYEQLAVESNSHMGYTNKLTSEADKKRFEIDREKLRQWDLMSSGLMKGRVGRVRGSGASAGVGDAACSTDTGTDSASNEASMTMSGAHTESGTNNNSKSQQALSKKAFLGSNTSIGRSSRDANIPVRAVSPRVRWVEDKQSNDHYGSQQMSTSQQNLNTLNTTEDSWASARSPSRASQQPIRAVSPRVRRNTENDEMDCLSSLKAMEREESLQRLEFLKNQLMELEHQYEKSKPLVQLVDNMVKLGSLYNRPGSTIERLERNQRLRQKVLAEHALEQQRWLESVAAGKSLETEAARARVAELWALEQELSDEAAILQGLRTDKDAIENLLSGVRGKLDSVHKGEINVEVNPPTPRRPTAPPSHAAGGLEEELARVQQMLAHNSKKLEQTVADNARLERELQQLRRALQARRAAGHQHHATNPTAMLEDEVSRVQQLVTALQRQRQELSRAVRHLTQQSHALQNTHDSMPGKRRPMSSWQETNLDTGHTIDHGHSDYDYDVGPLMPPGHYDHSNVETPLYVDTRGPGADVTSPLNSEDLQHAGFSNLTNVEKQEIKTVRIVKRESERRQRDRERSLQPMSDWPTNNITANLDQFLEEELVQSLNYSRSTSLPRNEQYEQVYGMRRDNNYLQPNMDLSPKYVSSPSLSNYDYSQNMSSLSSSYNKSYDRSGYDRTISLSTQYLNSPTDSSRTLTNDPLSKTSSVVSLTRSHMELSPIFKSEAAKQIITEMSGDAPKNGSLHRRQVPKEKRRHYTAPHHLSAKTLNEMPKDAYNQDKMGRSVDDADMERALRGAAPDVVRSALPPQALRLADNTIDQLLAAPQKILIPERYIPEKPPELSPEEQQKRQEKVESIKKMLTGTSADPNKSPDADEKRQREHLLQMNQILAKQVTEMSKIIAVKALEELPQNGNADDLDDRSPDVELPIYQQRDNFFT